LEVGDGWRRIALLFFCADGWHLPLGVADGGNNFCPRLPGFLLRISCPPLVLEELGFEERRLPGIQQSREWSSIPVAQNARILSISSRVHKQSLQRPTVCNADLREEPRRERVVPQRCEEMRVGERRQWIGERRRPGLLVQINQEFESTCRGWLCGRPCTNRPGA